MKVTLRVYRDGQEVATQSAELEEPKRSVRNKDAELMLVLPADADIRAGDVVVPDPIAYNVLGGRHTRGERTRIPLSTNLTFKP